MNDLPAGSERKRRADAERNRARVLEVARPILAEKGAAATLEAVAKAAGVGIGTLYRHFPNRDALLEAVYLRDAHRLADAAASLSVSAPSPAEALRSWLRLFIELLGARRGLGELVASATPMPLPATPAAATDAIPSARALIADAVAQLVEAVTAERPTPDPVDPTDLLRALVGVASGHTGTGWEDRAWHLADLLVAGLQHGA